MSDAISSIPNSEDIHLDLKNALNQDLNTTAFLSAFNSGLDTLSKRPELNSTSSPLDEVSGQFNGSVGETKATLVSDAGDGAAASAEEAAQSLETRFQTLYFELTHYQVAWRIAQNVQRDISQVLRGS